VYLTGFKLHCLLCKRALTFRNIFSSIGLASTWSNLEKPQSRGNACSHLNAHTGKLTDSRQQEALHRWQRWENYHFPAPLSRKSSWFFLYAVMTWVNLPCWTTLVVHRNRLKYLTLGHPSQMRLSTLWISDSATPRLLTRCRAWPVCSMRYRETYLMALENL
jgi:hypothetical protein